MSAEKTDIRELGRRVSKNTRLLEELLYRPKYKGELADALGVTKQTIYNRFKTLAEYDLVERQGGMYCLTTVGRPIVEKHVETLDAMQDVFDARRVLQEVPPEALPPGDVLESSRTVRPDGHPEQVREEFCKWVLGAEEVRGMLPSVSYTFIERLCAKLRSDGVTIEIALTPETMAYLRECCPDACCTVRESDSTVVIETPDIPSFGLVVMEEPRREAGLVVYSEDGGVRGFIQSPTQSGSQWAEEQLAKYTTEKEAQSTPSRVTID